MGVGERPRGVLTREASALDETDAIRLTVAPKSYRCGWAGTSLASRVLAAVGDPVRWSSNGTEAARIRSPWNTFTIRRLARKQLNSHKLLSPIWSSYLA